eukprot:4798283-Amphidinium_carterae.1
MQRPSYHYWNLTVEAGTGRKDGWGNPDNPLRKALFWQLVEEQVDVDENANQTAHAAEGLRYPDPSTKSLNPHSRTCRCNQQPLRVVE